MMLSAIGLLACAPAVGGAFHLPHDDVHDVAIAPTALGSGQEMLIVTNEEAKVLRSLDHGLTWESIAGEGLGRRRAVRVEYWNAPVDPRFWIATDKGIWAFYPATGEVRDRSAGLAAADAFVTEIAVSPNGADTVFIATKNGKVFSWDETGGSWTQLLSTGDSDPAAKLAVTPSYNPAAQPGADRMLLAGIAGRLHTSDDGGASWTIHPQFSTLASLDTEWHINGLAFARDFTTSGTMLVGRGRDNAGTVNGSEGQVWRSTDFGANYALSFSPISAVRELHATDLGPGGVRHFFLALEVYPDRTIPQSQMGVYRSDDGGLTWDDFGTWQDMFVDEPDTSVAITWRRFMGFAESPTYQTDGIIFLGRPESLFRSNDAGEHWLPGRFRAVLHLRGFEVTTDSNGDTLAFGAGYGSSTVLANVTQGTSVPLVENKIPYQNALAISPNYATDGAVLAGGATGIAYWFDPAKAGNNLFNALGWVFSGKNPFGYVRTIEISPHYDASGTIPGSDQSVIWSTRTAPGVPEETWRTLDGGKTAEKINNMVGGGQVPHLRQMVFAPTYDANTAAGRTDVYGSAGGYLWRLEDTEWDLVTLLPSNIAALAVDPNFSRPANPRLFAALADDPHIAEIIDIPGSPTVNLISAGGLTGEINSLDVHPDLANQPWVYVSTWGEGIFKLDIDAASPMWEPVGGSYPTTWAQFVRLAPDFLTSQQVIVGGQYGVVLGQDQAGAPWTPIPSDFMIDNIDPGFAFFQPNDPANSQPDRVWPWELIPIRIASGTYGLTLVGSNAFLTTSDGSYAVLDVKGSEFTLHTVEGSSMGTVTITASDFHTGTLLGSTVVDLAAGSPPLATTTVSLSIGATSEVKLRMEAQLDPGENFVVDAVTVKP